jgi:hypothetical protein
MALTNATTAALKIVSRSNRRCLGAVSSGNASRNCWITHAAVGRKVALKCRMRRRSWPMTKNP